MAQTHPILLYFDKTDRKDFPLALMIGREPNTSMEIAEEAGPYDFRQYPTAQFWNIAYGLMAESVGLQAWQLKKLCVQKQGSPLLFGNSLPIGIKFKDPEVHVKRETINNETAQRHIQKVFSFDLISRVRLVIMSGLESSAFAASRNAVKSECNTRGIHFAETPFLFGRNKSKINQILTDADRTQIKGIISAFLTT